MEIFNTIHKYLIAAAILSAFIHFVFLFIRASKKESYTDNLTRVELEKAGKENVQNGGKILRGFSKAFLILVLWIACISGYFVIMFKLGWIW